MHVRLSRIADLTAGETDAMITGFEDGTYPRGDLPELQGFRGYAAAADVLHGRVCAMSVWEDAWALAESRRVAAAARAERFAEVASEPIVDEYQVALWELGPDVSEGYIRVCRVAGLTEYRGRAMCQGFASNMNEVEQQAGFMGYLVARNERYGRVTSISQWRTYEDLMASEDAATRARERRLADVKPYREPLVDRYEIVAVRLAEPALA